VDLQRWLRNWRISIKVSKSTAVLTKSTAVRVKTARRIQKPRAVQFLGEPIQWVETAWYLGVTLDTQAYLVGARQPGRKGSSKIGRALPPQ
jgi:hypothetical protein